jgi:hypothetical protein
MRAMQFTEYCATLVLNDVAEPTVGEGDVPALQGSKGDASMRTRWPLGWGGPRRPPGQ